MNTDFGLDMLDYGARWYDPAIVRFAQVDPLVDVMPNWSPYTYTFNNPILFTDPTGMIPIYGTDGNFLGHYDNDSYDGEIMIVDAGKYLFHTGGEETLITMDELTELGGTSFTDHIANNIDIDSEFDMGTLSNIFTDLIDRANADGLIDISSSDLLGGKIHISNDTDYPSLAAAENRSGANKTNLDIRAMLKPASKSEVSDDRYASSTNQFWYLTHAGDAINILGIHEPLHGKYSSRGNGSKGHGGMMSEMNRNSSKYQKAEQHASAAFLEQLKTWGRKVK